MNGLLLINKPKGITSHDVVNYIRKITKVKKVGHTGTLDPNASGLLIICIGEATKLIPYIENGNKIYEAVIDFGKSTDTDDILGNVISEKSVDNLTEEDLIKELEKFKGEIDQVPPIYSAKKIKGKKLYEYARKNVDIEIKPSKVTINNIEIINKDEFPNSITLLINCSKGTYIRAIARDLGKALNNEAYLRELKRLNSNNFDLKDSINLNDIIDINDIITHLLPLEEIVKSLKVVSVNPTSEKFLINGNKLFSPDVNTNLNEIEIGENVALTLNGKLKAIGIKQLGDNSSIYIQPKKMLNT